MNISHNVDKEKVIFGRTISIDVSESGLKGECRVCIKNIDNDAFVLLYPCNSYDVLTFPASELESKFHYAVKIQAKVDGKWQDAYPYKPLILPEQNNSSTTEHISYNSCTNYLNSNICMADIIDVCPFCNNKLEIQSTSKGDHCPHCNSAARERALSKLLKRIRLPGMKSLFFSTSPREKKIICGAYPELTDRDITSVSLYGDYLRECGHIEGVDVRDLSIFSNESFHCVYSCLLFDYFSEHESALEEISRILAPEGIFLTHIAPYRLEKGFSQPYTIRKIKTRSDYMNYVPNEALEDVHVGLDWFLTAMRRTGLNPIIYTWHDALITGDVTWIVAYKTNCSQKYYVRNINSSNLVNSFNIKTEWKKLFEIHHKFDSNDILLRFEGLVTPQKINFLNYSQGKIFARLGQFITYSDDCGNTFRRLFQISSRNYISQLFPLMDGGYILHEEDGGSMIRVDDSGHEIERKQFPYRWHGLLGIGQSVSKTCMYGDYPRKDQIINDEIYAKIHRFHDEQWDTPLKFLFAKSPNQGGDIRHFHCITPLNDSTWLATSGDQGQHLKILISSDDGNSWKSVEVREVEGLSLPDADKVRLLRLTSFIPLSDSENRILYGTDDTMGNTVNESLLVEANLNTGLFKILGKLGVESCRNIIKLGNDFYLTLHEAKRQKDNIYFNLIYKDRQIKRFIQPNLLKSFTPFSESMASRFVDNGYFYFSDNYCALANNVRIIRCNVVLS